MLKKLLTNKRFMLFLKILPFILIAVIFVWFWLSGEKFSVENLLAYSPKNPLLAVFFLLLLYAFKSLSVFLPIMALYIAGGTLFPPFIAILVNLAGTMICTVIPYWLGYFSGADYAQHLLDKYPKIAAFMDAQKKNDIFLCYFLRIISILPGDIVSLYLGASKMNFFNYLIGSLLGVIPGTILCTLMGSSITNPLSPTFLVSTSFTVVLSVASFVGYRIWKKKKHEKQEETELPVK